MEPILLAIAAVLPSIIALCKRMKRREEVVMFNLVGVFFFGIGGLIGEIWWPLGALAFVVPSVFWVGLLTIAITE